jgi:hypothetical protein
VRPSALPIVEPVAQVVVVQADQVWRDLPTVPGRPWMTVSSPIDLNLRWAIGATVYAYITTGVSLAASLPVVTTATAGRWQFRNAAGIAAGFALAQFAAEPQNQQVVI